MNDDRDDPQNDEDVNEPSPDMECEKAEGPQDEQDNRECEKHGRGSRCTMLDSGSHNPCHGPVFAAQVRLCPIVAPNVNKRRHSSGWSYDDHLVRIKFIQKRQAEHIEEGYENRGVSDKEAERRAWATVNKETGGGKKSGSGRGHGESHGSSRKGGTRGGSR
jgi:hypothetical protein